MNSTVRYYDIYPMVTKVGKKTKISIRPRGMRQFDKVEHRIVVAALSEGGSNNYPDRVLGNAEFKSTPDEHGALSFTYDFPLEGQYFVRIFNGNVRLPQNSLYAVGEDLAGRIPRIGDLHLHTCRSDGRELPEKVAANYREFGYDFLSITDHHRFFPSLEVMYSYRNVDHAITFVTGEEVHMPGNPVHIINFGGKFSINSLIKDSYPTKDDISRIPRPGVTKEDVSKFALRAVDENDCPEQMSEEEFRREIEEIAKGLSVPEYIDNEKERYMYAACLWEFDKIRQAGGLGIFAHPYWISDLFQLSESFTDYMLRQHPFDAFELLGGERYYEQNGYQTAKYNNIRAEGIDFPIVGSTDSHWSNGEAPNAHVARTMVFPLENSRECLIDAIKSKYSVAIDGILSEPRLIGDFRLIKYAWFLLENYFPLHDKVAREDGRAMGEYTQTDDPDEKAFYAERIAECKRELKRLEEKYFSF